MTDTFAEQLVQKTQNQSDSVKKVLILAGGGVIAALMLFLTSIFPLTFIFAALAVYVVYILYNGLNIEYEYTITNGSLDIDKIIAKRKRKRLVAVDVKNFTAFGRFESGDDCFGGTVILAAGGEKEAFYADFKNESYGEVRLIFSPNEKILKCIKPYLPRNLKF